MALKSTNLNSRPLLLNHSHTEASCLSGHVQGLSAGAHGEAEALRAFGDE